MDDEQIVKLYIGRDERAILETKEKYGCKIYNTALKVLHDFRDAAECENDTYYNAWKGITTAGPQNLLSYLIRIAHNAAVDMLTKKTAYKRNGICVELYEIDYGVNVMTIERHMDSCEIKRVMNDYLNDISVEKNTMFRLRYHKCESVSHIAGILDVSESKVKTTIYRMKNDLKERFREAGIEI